MPIEYDPQEKELVKRLDWKLIPILCIYYFAILMVSQSNVESIQSNSHVSSQLAIRGIAKEASEYRSWRIVYTLDVGCTCDW
jgi:hypothetical protein